MRHVAISTLPLLLLAACSSDAAGPGGGGGNGSDLQHVEFTIKRIVVEHTCDEFPVDADGGEWSHELTIQFPGETSTFLGSSANYPNASSKTNVAEDDELSITTTRTHARDLEDVEGTTIALRFSATEWDYDVFGGNPAADSRMDDRTATRIFTFEDGEWPQEPSGTLVLDNTEACRAVVSFSISATPA